MYENYYSCLQKFLCIGDSGASCYITNDETQMYDITDFEGSVKGNPSTMKATK